jgi:hypothetical protein
MQRVLPDQAVHTNINNMNNHLSPQIIEHKKTTPSSDGNPIPGWRQAQK